MSTHFALSTPFNHSQHSHHLSQIKLIDNEAALQAALLSRGTSRSIAACGFDSMLLPTTQRQEILRLGFPVVMKRANAADGAGRDGKWRARANPQLLFDYRCYLQDGREEMGTEYPPQIKRCLSDIAGKSVREVQDHYGLKDELPARNLKLRATGWLGWLCPRRRQGGSS